MPLARPTHVAGALQREPESRFVALELGDLCPQHRVVEPTGRVQTDCCGSLLAQRLGGFTVADATDHLALVRQQMLGDVPAAALLADQVALFHPHVVEEGFAERALARNQLDRLGADAG